MLIDKYLEITINASNFKRYKELGYTFNKVGDIIIVSIEHLSKGSGILVNAQCGKCAIQNIVSYCNYNKQFYKGNSYMCRKCAYSKTKLTNLNRYGYEHI